MTVNIDGTEISNVTIDGRFVHEATVDGDVVYTADVIDSFEHNDWQTYYNEAHDTGFGSPDNPTVEIVDESSTSHNAVNGSYMLRLQDSISGATRIVSNPSEHNLVSKYPEFGDDFKIYVLDYNNSAYAGFELNYGNDVVLDVSLQIDGGLLDLTDYNGNEYRGNYTDAPTGQWHSIEVLHNGDDVTVKAYKNDSDTVIDSYTFTANTKPSGEMPIALENGFDTYFDTMLIGY